MSEQTCKELVPESEAHECPYYADIHGDKTLCRCCPDCTHECAMDI